MSDLILDNGVYRSKENNLPISGKVHNFYKGRRFLMGNLINGKKEGPWVEWHPIQRQLRETYKDGHLDGSVSFFYKNGQREWRYTYNNGILDGAYTKWYKDGVKAVDGWFENGEPKGIWAWWDEDGNIIKSEKFERPTRGINDQHNEYIQRELIH